MTASIEIRGGASDTEAAAVITLLLARRQMKVKVDTARTWREIRLAALRGQRGGRGSRLSKTS